MYSWWEGKWRRVTGVPHLKVISMDVVKIMWSVQLQEMKSNKQ